MRPALAVSMVTQAVESQKGMVGLSFERAVTAWPRRQRIRASDGLVDAGGLMTCSWTLLKERGGVVETALRAETTLASSRLPGAKVLLANERAPKLSAES